MARLSEQIGRPVRTADGEAVGSIHDLVVSMQDPYPAVQYLVVGPPRKAILVGWADVASFDPAGIGLAPEATHAPAVESVASLLAWGELLLGRDVLDTQVVDLGNRRIARVGDVLLTEGVDGQVVAAAVDVGFGAVCRRLGLRRIGDRIGEALLDWRELHLTSARGHQVQLDTSASLVHRLTSDELAALLGHLSTMAATDVLAVVPREHAAAAIQAASPDVIDRMAASMGAEQATAIVDALPAEHAERFRRARRAPTSRRRYLRHRGKRRTKT